MRYDIISISTAALTLSMASGLAAAQAAVPRCVFGTAAGESSGGRFTVRATGGQPVVGGASSPRFVVQGGFWAGFDSQGMPCNPGDLSPAFGTLDVNDVLVFAAAFNAQQPIADFFLDGMFDINDVLTFAQAFNAGCP